MEIMKKIGLVFVIAALGVAGYVLVNRHSAMSESGNVVIQNKKVGLGGFCKHDDSCKSGKCKDGTCRSNSKVANGLSCIHDGTCESGLCTDGTCRGNDGPCRKNSDCAQDRQYCASSKCRNKKNDGELATQAISSYDFRHSSCKSDKIDADAKCCSSGPDCGGFY